MATLQDATSGTSQRIEAGGAARVSNYSIGERYSASSITGVMAAALGAGSSIFAMRLPVSATKVARIARMRLQWTTLTAFTVPVTAGRRLALFRGSGGTPSGAASLIPAIEKDSSTVAAQMDGGAIQIATTVALTMTSVVFDANPVRSLSLSHAGAAGGFVEQTLEFNDDFTTPIVLRAGELIAIRNPVVMDAAGTFQLVVNVDWTELTELA